MNHRFHLFGKSIATCGGNLISNKVMSPLWYQWQIVFFDTDDFIGSNDWPHPRDICNDFNNDGYLDAFFILFHEKRIFFHLNYIYLTQIP